MGVIRSARCQFALRLAALAGGEKSNGTMLCRALFITPLAGLAAGTPPCWGRDIEVATWLVATEGGLCADQLGSERPVRSDPGVGIAGRRFSCEQVPYRRLRELEQILICSKGVTVPPAFEWAFGGAFRGSGSGRAVPRHPGATCLGLLPSGPDPIHNVPPRGTRPSTPLDPGANPPIVHPRAGDQPRMKRFSGSGHP